MFKFIQSHLRKILQIVFILILLILFFIFFKQIDLNQLWNSLQKASYPILFFALFCSCVMILIKSFQLSFYLKKIGFSSWFYLFQTTAVWQMVVNFFPFGGAEAISVYLFHYKLNVSKIQSISMMTMEKLADGISLLAVFLFLAIVSDIPHWMKSGIYTLTALILFFLVFVVFIAYRFKNLELKLAGEMKSRFRTLLSHFSKWVTHLHLLRDWKRGIYVSILGIAIKLIEGIILYSIQKSLGFTFPYWTPFLVIAALNISLSIPVIPGNLGVFEMTVSAVYLYAGANFNTALSFGILYHLIYALPPMIIGYLVSLQWGLKIKKISNFGEKSIIH